MEKWQIEYGREAWEADVPVEAIRQKQQNFGTMGLPKHVILGDELDFIPGKVISIQARVETPAGEAIITLGAVANPATWIKGIEDNPSLSRAEKDAQIAEAKHYEE
jgi:hypothetical protein